MKMPSSSAQDRQVSIWFQKIENGEIKLPRFQRHQAWDKTRICSLLDTVINNLPLGVTLLLNVDKEQFVYFIKNLFNRKLSWEQHSFTGIVAAGERIVIFCPEGSDQTTIILSHILSWKDHFKQISIILSDYDYTFFKRIDRDESTTYFNINNRVRPFNNSVILNFSSDKKIRDIFDHCEL